MPGQTKQDVMAELRKRKLKVSGSIAEVRKRLDDALAADPTEKWANAASTDARPALLKPGEALKALLCPKDMTSVTQPCLEVLTHCASKVPLTTSHGMNMMQLQGAVKEHLESTDIKPDVSAALSTFAFGNGAADQGWTTLEHTAIKEAILKFFRQWSQTFPKITKAVFPADFDLDEKDAIRAFVGKYVLDEKRGLCKESMKEEDFKHTVADILADNSFPVAKGHHKAVVHKVVKIVRTDELHQQRNAKKRKHDAFGEW